MSTPQPRFHGFRKSTFSNGEANCVEIGIGEGELGVQDSKQKGAGPVLAFHGHEWTAFVADVKAGFYDKDEDA
jgi:hypothetical protein